MILFTNQVLDANSEAYVADFPNYNHISYTLLVAGVMDGASVKVQTSADEINWVDVDSIVLTSATTLNFELNTIAVRAVLSGAGTLTDVSVAIQSSEKAFITMSDKLFQEALLIAIAATTAAVKDLDGTTDGHKTLLALEQSTIELKKISLHLGYQNEFQLDDEDVT